MNLAPLRFPAFRRLWTASAVAAIGGSFSVVAVPVQLFTLTGSSSMIGVSAAVSMGALAAAALWSGVLADRMDRRRLLLASHTLMGVAHLGLWLNIRYESMPVLLTLVALQGLSFGATMTTTGAVVPRVVPAGQLVAANSLSSLTRYTGAIAGPLLAGALIPVVGLGTLYLYDALALCLVLWAVARLPAMPPAMTRTRRAGLGEALRYLRRHRILVAILGVDLSAMVFAMPVALFPELALRVFGEADGIGLLFAAYPAGVFLCGLFSGTFGNATRHGVLMVSAAVLWGGCVIVLGFATRLWLAVAALVAGGAVNFVLSTFRNAISQAYTDDALRGRIQGLLVVVLMGGPQLANLWHGLAGVAAIGAGGLLTVVAVALITLAVPELWRYDVSDPTLPAAVREDNVARE